jgi:alpha-amylase
MKRQLITLAVATLLATGALAGSTAEWKKRTVYQVLTDRFAKGSGDKGGCDLHNYCGGNYDGLTNQLDYIKDLGFDAIWISPVVDNLDKGYHGYWARNWEKLNSNFGDSDSLTNFVKAAHNKGIWVMVDVVANHVAPIEHDFSQIYPLN